MTRHFRSSSSKARLKTSSRCGFGRSTLYCEPPTMPPLQTWQWNTSSYTNSSPLTNHPYLQEVTLQGVTLQIGTERRMVAAYYMDRLHTSHLKSDITTNKWLCALPRCWISFLLWFPNEPYIRVEHLFWHLYIVSWRRQNTSQYAPQTHTIFSCVRHFINGHALTQDELSIWVCIFSKVICSSHVSCYGIQHNVRRSTQRFLFWPDGWRERFHKLWTQSPDRDPHHAHAYSLPFKKG